MPPSAIVSSEFFALAIYHFLQEAVSRSRKFRSTKPLTQSYAAAASETRSFPVTPQSRLQHEVTYAPHLDPYCLEGYVDRGQSDANGCRLKYRTKQDMDDLSGAARTAASGVRADRNKQEPSFPVADQGKANWRESTLTKHQTEQAHLVDRLLVRGKAAYVVSRF